MSGVMVPPVSHNLKRLSGHSLAQIPGPFGVADALSLEYQTPATVS